MAYDVFKKTLDKEGYFKTWQKNSYDELTEELKEELYKVYLFKQEVFARDDFTCQNKDCPYCENQRLWFQLTIHHIKHKKNGGENKPRNAVLICDSSHKAFNKGRDSLTFDNKESLPPHIRGHTFKLSKSDKAEWKAFKADMDKVRKNHKRIGGKPVNWKLVNILLKWLLNN